MTSWYVDLSHPIEHEMTTYPGLPGPAISTYISREKSAQRLGTGVSFHIGRIEMVANTGTYVDAPYHFHAKSADVAALLLERLVDVLIVVIRASGRAAIGPEVLDDRARCGARQCSCTRAGHDTGELRRTYPEVLV